MANPTTNFGWVMPTSTDLVTDLPADFAVFGQGVDTTLADLKGGTTGQVLSKTSNTDMDFTWVTQDDANAIQNTIVDAKGDLITATAADTPARLAVGANDYVLTADSTQATGLKWAAVASGGMTLLSSTSMNGGTNVSVTGISSAYKNLQIQVLDIGLNGAYGIIKVTFNSDTTNYRAVMISSSNSTTIGSVTNGVPLTYNTTNQDTGGDDNSAVINVYNYADTTTWKAFDFCAAWQATAGAATIGGGNFKSTSAISSVQITTSAGSFAGGTINIYGVK